MKDYIKITNPNKIIFPKSKIKKIDVINYYIEVNKLMLPYIQNRLLSVIRCHKNIADNCFFKKHPTTDKNMVNLFQDDDEEYFYITSSSQLIYQAQMGSLEFHTWASDINNINKPNIMVLDLDPDEKLSLSKLRDAVKKIKSLLDKLNITCYLKTSGGKGYHILIPFKQTKDWQSFYDFSKNLAQLSEQTWPNVFTTNISKSKRKGKIFIDYLRNNRGSTCVAPFSIRARENAPISMPISWKDLDNIKPNEITIFNFKKYLNNSWKNFFSTQQTLKK